MKAGLISEPGTEITSGTLDVDADRRGQTHADVVASVRVQNFYFLTGFTQCSKLSIRLANAQLG
jgi:hypothetical protein